MKVRTIIQIVLAVVIIGLGFLLFKNFKKDIDFDNEYTARRNACAEKLKVIRTLEEAYKQTYGVYCGNFDTLINRLMNEDSLLVNKEEYDEEAIAKAGITVHDVQNMASDEARTKGFIVERRGYVNPIEEFRKKKDNKDFIIIDPRSGVDRQITDDEIRNIRYVPGFGKDKEFKLVAKQNEGVWVFMAWIDFEDLYVGDKIDPVLLKNKIAAINEKSKKLLDQNPDADPIYTSWRVGDTLKPETRGNFE
jgi:hypothetical protein